MIFEAISRQMFVQIEKTTPSDTLLLGHILRYEGVGTQTFIQNHRKAILKINVLYTYNPKWYFQQKMIITQMDL